MRIGILVMIVGSLAACSSPGGPYPSLQPRAAEAIDPRLQPPAVVNDRPATPAIRAKLAELIDEARAGDSAFEPAIAKAEELASGAGAPQTEGWIAAQEALSAAIAARKPTATALGDIDALGATTLQAQQGLSPSDLGAIQEAAATVGAIDKRQADRVAAIQSRLGL